MEDIKDALERIAAAVEKDNTMQQQILDQLKHMQHSSATPGLCVACQSKVNDYA
tara:strand:- start:3824 stop:3985 length:162 start_codon:yes stop_codon:yes gene_type:complete